MAPLCNSGSVIGAESGAGTLAWDSSPGSYGQKGHEMVVRVDMKMINIYHKQVKVIFTIPFFWHVFYWKEDNIVSSFDSTSTNNLSNLVSKITFHLTGRHYCYDLKLCKITHLVRNHVSLQSPVHQVHSHCKLVSNQTKHLLVLCLEK